jgi:hypothetical protein
MREEKKRDLLTYGGRLTASLKIDYFLSAGAIRRKDYQ